MAKKYRWALYNSKFDNGRGMVVSRFETKERARKGAKLVTGVRIVPVSDQRVKSYFRRVNKSRNSLNLPLLDAEQPYPAVRVKSHTRRTISGKETHVKSHKRRAR